MVIKCLTRHLLLLSRDNTSQYIYKTKQASPKRILWEKTESCRKPIKCLTFNKKISRELELFQPHLNGPLVHIPSLNSANLSLLSEDTILGIWSLVDFRYCLVCFHCFLPSSMRDSSNWKLEVVYQKMKRKLQCSQGNTQGPERSSDYYSRPSGPSEPRGWRRRSPSQILTGIETKPSPWKACVV